MGLEQGYNVTEVGSWPYETYDIKPVTPNQFSLGADHDYDYTSKYFYSNTGNVEIDNIHNSTSPVYVTYTNIEKSIDADGMTNIAWKDSSSKITFQMDDLRKNNYGPICNLWKMYGNNSNTLYSFLHFPKRLVLLPVSSKKISMGGGNYNYVLTLSSITRDNFITYYSDPQPESENSAPTSLKGFNATLANNQKSYISNNTLSLIYNISASQTIVKKSYTLANYKSINLEPALIYKKLRPDTFFITGNITFFNSYVDINNKKIDYWENLTYRYLDDPEAAGAFTPGFIMYYYPATNRYTQTFSYVQSSNNVNTNITDASCSMLSAVIALNNGSIKYYQKTKTVGTTTVPIVTATDNKLEFSYILDSDTFLYSKELVYNTINDFYVHGSPNASKSNLGEAFSLASSQKNDTVTFITEYPPYYYTYSVCLKSNTGTGQHATTEDTFLDFDCSLQPISDTTLPSFSAECVIRSTLNLLTLDIDDYSDLGEKIKYTPQLASEELLDDTIFYYKKNGTTRTVYDLKNSPWIDLTDGKTLEIINPKSYTGNPTLTIRPTISTVCGLKDGYLATKITLTGQYASPTYDLVINTIEEDNDYIDISAETMIDDSVAPGIDLRGSDIKWTVSPTTSYVKINALNKSSTGKYSPWYFLTNGQRVAYDNKTWAVRVSGYGDTSTTITLSSAKQNRSASITTDKFFYNAFSDNKLIVEPKIALDNSPEIRTVTLKIQLPYKNRILNLPLNEDIYWNYTYTPDIPQPNDLVLSYPISAFYENGNIYTIGESSISQNLSSLKFFINPPKTSTPSLNKIKVSAYTTSTQEYVYGEYEFSVDNFPDETTASADFKVAYFDFQTETILDTKKQQTTLTRSSNQNTNYICIPYTNNNITYDSVEWSLLKPDGTTQIITTLNANYTLTTNGKYLLKLTYKNAKTPEWSNTHDISKTVILYRLDSTVFDKKLEFITHPEYTWRNSDQITLIGNNNYTLATSPTAYSYKKSKTENFWVSSGASFNRFIYVEGSNKKILSDSESGVKNVKIDYSTNFSSSTGTTIYLSAYNDYYPYNTPLYYRALESGVIITRSYNITAQSIPYSPSTPNISLFFQNPKIVDYNGITHTFSAIITSFDLDFNRNVYIQQKFKTNPLNTPAKIITDTSTVIYTLSTSKWVSQKQLPATDGIYKVFTLRPGDDMSPLRVSNTNKNTLYLNASSNLSIKIPESTFDTVNIGNLGLLFGGDLWDSKDINIDNRNNWETIVAYSTSTKPEIYLNTFYSLTGNEVFVEFKTPNYNTNPISAYAVNFGDNNIQTKTIDKIFYNTYPETGTYYITYSAIYTNYNKETYIQKIPFTIKNYWPHYDENSVRIISETVLKLPYNLNDIHIQPNEFGDSDIFNTSLKRLDDNLQYIKNNIQTMNSFAPNYYYGWMGSNTDNRSDGIRWYTETYGSEFYNVPSYTTNIGKTFFTNVKDIYFGKYIYVIDDNKFRLFEKDKNCKEVVFANSVDMDDLFFNPTSLVLNSDETSIYVADSFRNKIYRFDLDFTDTNNPIFTLVVSTGGIGALNDTNKFDYSTDLYFHDDYIFVLDYNNNCVKQFSTDLAWVYTYYDDLLQDDQISTIAVHKTGLLYVVTKNLKVHIFDNFSESVYTSFSILEISELDTSDIVRASFDESGEFLYIVTKNNIFKYTSLGQFITTFNLPDVSNLEFTSCKSSDNRSINVSTKTSILRFQDFVELYKIGDGAESKYWTLDQIILKKEEFATDLNYNLALNRTAQNIKTFRNSLNGKFVIVTEQTNKGTVRYFSLVPSTKDDYVELHSDVEKEQLKIGINEFHIPSVINRELTKLYNSQINLQEKLDVKATNNDKSDINGASTSDCVGNFCWSWKSMSCYDLTFPMIRLCNINPITYAELTSAFPVNYAPSKQWKDAFSDCCTDYASPLI